MPNFITSIKLLSASENDYQKLFTEMGKRFIYPSNKQGLSKSNTDKIYIFNDSRHESLLEATIAVSQAASQTNKKFRFTIIKDKKRMEF